MKRFFYTFWLQLGRLLRQGAAPACLLLMVAGTLLLGLLLPGGGESVVKVGVYIPPGSERGGEIWNALCAYPDAGIDYLPAESEAQLEEMVAARLWEYGYMFPERLDERLAEGKYKRLITFVTAPASMPVFSSWTLSAAVLEVVAPQIAADFLAENGMPLTEETAGLASGFFADDNLMKLDMRQLYGGQGETGPARKESTGAMLARGLLALGMFLVCCLGAVRHAGDMAGGFFRRLAPATSAAGLFFPGYLAVGALCAAAGAVCIVLGRLFFAGAYGSLGYELALLLVYVAYLGAVSFVLALVFRRGEGLVACTPFLLIACLVLCPVFFDSGRWLPPLRWLTPALPPTLYLRGAAGEGAVLWLMPAGAAALFGLGLGLCALRGKFELK